MNNEDIFEKLLNKTKQGLSIEESVFDLPQNKKQEAVSFLQTAALLSSLPKNQPPTPALRRKYTLAPASQPRIWLSFFHISRFAAGSVSVALLISLFTLGGYKTFASLPGQPLFKVKRTAENVRLKFVIDKKAKTQLQLAMTQTRFNEAQTILNDPSSNKKQEIAALEELSSQTKTAADSVQELTMSQPLEEESQPIVTKLESLAKQQSQLIEKTLTEDEEVKVAATGASESAGTVAAQVDEIKKYLAIAEAEAGPQTLVDLSADPNSISLSGVIQKSEKAGITVEKITFLINDQTEIRDLQGQKLEQKNLEPGIKVKVSGKKDNNRIFAENIIVLTGGDAIVKGAATSTPSTGSTTPAAFSSSTSTAPSQAQTTTPSSLITPKEESIIAPEKPRVGSFLIEDPYPKYNP